MTQPAETTKPKKMNPKQLRRTLYWLALDWINLRNNLPTPQSGQLGRRTNSRIYGHPAEWASDKAAEIVDILTSWHDNLAEIRNETPPPKGAEEHRLIAAWKYLEPRCEQLAEEFDAEDLKELPDLHHKIRRTLGENIPKYTLPIPCPNTDCGLRTLVRVQGVGQDFISCDACGYTIKETHYPLLIRMTLDAFINGAAA
ncbi:hypothetical protein I5H56_gp097 [Mycobacterium phage KristaRAM]|uniref:DNA binding protein n=1 Tax=Mycobacterium phage KristaRAM TaxID=2301700 RepID=A0A385DXP3_9CAUD|nr:hypothetical protein I5H56_gp097 [Mycobacterium phage KristaRAM]AXQ64154.1 hypothetical protein SEA_KRISTARAM_97 [Mycobacterium phage KristaRAM]